MVLACTAMPSESRTTHHVLYVVCCADNEKRLVKKCRELNSEIVGNAAKVQTALKLSEEDQQTIVALKKEIEKAWKMVDSSHEKVRVSSRQAGLRRQGGYWQQMKAAGAACMCGCCSATAQSMLLPAEAARCPTCTLKS